MRCNSTPPWKDTIKVKVQKLFNHVKLLEKCKNVLKLSKDDKKSTKKFMRWQKLLIGKWIFLIKQL
ncbi:hypothetical protein NUSPORA_02585 [Nucleospora cyclopteri]